MQTDLFDNTLKSNRDITIEIASSIEGLQLYFDFITVEEEIALLSEIESNPWLSDLKRRVQHYGYKYDYRARKIDNSFYLGGMPEWLDILSRKLIDAKIINFKPDQAIVNEYEPGQGISPHIDCEPCFGDTIVSISLGSHCVMNYCRDIAGHDKNELLIEPRSIMVMTTESRYNWYHGIPARKTDIFNNNKFSREKRISITFRKVII